MRAADINVNELGTGFDCIRAIQRIHRDHENFEGPLEDWVSGTAALTDEAEHKVNAIDKRMTTLSKEVF